MDFVVFQGDVVLEDAVPAHSVSRQRGGGAACAMEERDSALVICNECARAKASKNAASSSKRTTFGA